MVLFYVFVRLATTVLSATLYVFDIFCDGDFTNPVYATVTVLNFAGVTVAVSSLLTVVTNAHPAMEHRGIELAWEGKVKCFFVVPTSLAVRGLTKMSSFGR